MGAGSTSPSTLMDLPSSARNAKNYKRTDDMKRLIETIADYGGAMRELGRIEATCNACDDDKHKEVLQEDRDKVKVRVAQAKLAMLSAKTTSGGSLLDWDKDKEQVPKFFEPIQ